MLSRLLRRLLLSQILGGALLGGFVARQTGVSLGLAVVAALLMPLLMLLLTLLNTAIKSRAPGANALWWRSLWGEFVTMSRIYLLLQPWAKAPPVVGLASGSSTGVPVLLVHGYLCNHRVWDAMAQQLRRAGHPVLAVDLEPLFTSIDAYAVLIEQAVNELCRQTGAEKVALIGHSMGGLAIRAWMRIHGNHRITRVITLGTPHAGTQMTFPLQTVNATQMGWRSDWLGQLAMSESAATRSLMRIGLTPQDHIVYPQREQVLEGVPVTAFGGLGHLELCFNFGVLAWVLQQLQDVAAGPQSPVHPRPESLSDLFWSFNGLALQGFGGVLAVVQRELVEKKQWLTHEEFLEDWAVAQILPGPNVVNLSLMIGDRYFGLRGAGVALAGMLALPLLIVLALAAMFAGISDSPNVQDALRGMGAVAAGLIAATGLKLISALKKNVMGAAVCWSLAAISFVAIAILRVPLAWLLFSVGGLACAWAYRQLGRVRVQETPR